VKRGTMFFAKRIGLYWKKNMKN
jgi:hypothetical protein